MTSDILSAIGGLLAMIGLAISSYNLIRYLEKRQGMDSYECRLPTSTAVVMSIIFPAIPLSLIFAVLRL